jgi:hypothetical protein
VEDEIEAKTEVKVEVKEEEEVVTTEKQRQPIMGIQLNQIN